MVALKKLQAEHGFTIVELLIVIIIIGILAALVITTFNGIQQRARDNERETDIKALHSQVEAYFVENDRYPTLSDLNDTTSGGFLEIYMKGLDKEALRDPDGSSEVLVALPTRNSYAYVTSPVTCDNVIIDCVGYTLTATYESGTTFVKQNLN